MIFYKDSNVEQGSYRFMITKKFIEAAKDIMNEEGIDKVTIRKVSSRVGVNSATIYNHFDNLECLKVFACLFVFDEYIKDLENYIDEDSNSEQNYLNVWKCFIKHTSENVEVFYTLFFNGLEKHFDEYLKEYYHLFPIKKDKFKSSILKMLSVSNLEKRNEILLEEMARDNIIMEEKINWINEVSTYTYESILFRMYKNKIDIKEGTEKMYDFINAVLDNNRV